jgi:hypothetical protein
MMGSTYSKVKDDLDREWKFYRYCLITEFIKASASPPQLIPIFVPLTMLKKFLTDSQTQHNGLKLPIKKTSIDAMNRSKQKYVPVNWVKCVNCFSFRVMEKEKEAEGNTLESVSKFIRESTRNATIHCNGDRTLLNSPAFCWSLVVGRWSLVVGRWSLVVGRWSLVVGRWLFVRLFVHSFIHWYFFFF